MGSERSDPPTGNLKFLPRALTENCQRLIESYHAIHGYASLPDILWRAHAHDFVEMHDDLRFIFRKAAITRSAKKANSSYVSIASALLSLEILAGDFLGWGTRFPFARRKAAYLLGEFLPHGRQGLKNVYLRQPYQVVSAAISPPELSVSRGEFRELEPLASVKLP
jgi:hypothetical protein